jgi:threonylcarbamoyladenosine tRNA methylthiotransferase MtaB
MSNGSLHDRQTITLDAGNPVSASDDAGTVAIHTHGCKLNQADSSILARQFRRAGYRVVEDVRDADIYVLNTCTVTSTADSKARQALRAARRINPDAIVVAAGCYPQRAAGELEQMPAVNLVVGNAEKAKLASLAIAAHRERIGADSGYLDGDYERLDDYSASGLLPGRTRGMVKIQEGCDQVCSYCIVPRVRGRERSIPPEQIVRLRISSLQPQELGEDLLRLWLEDCRLCPHFHVPLQSGSDTILKAMRRRYTTGRFAETVQMVRSLVPDSGITTDLIVGFPGEGPREFEESLAFASEMEFSDLHAFPYSRRPGTSAVYLEDHVPEPVKRERMQQVLELAHNSFISFRTNLLGSTRPVLWEGQEGVGGSQRGLTDNYVRVEREVDEQGEQFSGLTNKVTQARLVELQGKQVKARPLP